MLVPRPGREGYHAQLQPLELLEVQGLACAARTKQGVDGADGARGWNVGGRRSPTATGRLGAGVGPDQKIEEEAAAGELSMPRSRRGLRESRLLHVKPP